MTAPQQAGPGDTGAGSFTAVGRPPVRRRALAVALAFGTALLAAACTSGGSSAESASTPTASTPAAATSTSGPGSAAASPNGSATVSSPSPRSSTGSTPASSASSSSGTAPGGGSDAAGATYCESKGGQVQTRDATYGTNGPQTAWLPMAGSIQVCRFQANDEARSRIYVDFATLTSARPTLAGLAYLSRPPVPASSGGANPATGYCSKLGGSSTFGEISANGGGWVNKDDPDDVVVGLCVFPDESFIDEWGLAYHSGGVVRGQDLTQVMTYQPPDPLPAVFPVGTPTEQPSTGSSGLGGASSSSATPSSAPTS